MPSEQPTHFTKKPIRVQTKKVITTEKMLRSIIPNYSKILDKRIQPKLDKYSLEFIHVSAITFLATNSNVTSITPIHVSDELQIQDKNHFIISLPHTCEALFISPTPLNASLYFMAPSVGHGLRVNGTLTYIKDSAHFKIEEVYFHCARAAARAEIWTSKISENIKESHFIEHARFLLLKTMNSKTKTELSPRGDEIGFVKVLSEKTLLLPERPGNKIAVSLRNIIHTPDIEILFLIPGACQTLNVKGTAEVISDETILEQCSVNGKRPKLGILIHINSTSFKNNLSRKLNEVWDSKNAIEKTSITSFSKALSAHINGTGLLGKATHTIISGVVKHDMKNLY